MKTEIASAYRVRAPRWQRLTTIAVGTLAIGCVIWGLQRGGNRSERRSSILSQSVTTTRPAEDGAVAAEQSARLAAQTAQDSARRQGELAESKRRNEELLAALARKEIELELARKEQERMHEQTRRDLEARKEQENSEQVRRDAEVRQGQTRLAKLETEIRQEGERQAALVAQFRGVAVAWVKAAASSSPEDQLSQYAEEVDFLDEGMRTPSQLRLGLVAYQLRFAQRSVTLLGEPAVQVLSDGGNAVVRASYDYSYIDTKKNEPVSKHITNEIGIRLDANGPRITRVRMPENIVIPAGNALPNAQAFSPSREAVESLLRAYYEAGDPRSAVSQADFFTSPAEYFEEGTLKRSAIRERLVAYNRKHPVRMFRLQSVTGIVPGPGSATVTTTFTFLSDPDGLVRGRTHWIERRGRFVLVPAGDRLMIRAAFD